jgi:ankyrin repeat protein
MACEEQGRTALSYAASYGSLDCLQVLGTAGADPFHEDLEVGRIEGHRVFPCAHSMKS